MAAVTSAHAGSLRTTNCVGGGGGSFGAWSSFGRGSFAGGGSFGGGSSSNCVDLWVTPGDPYVRFVPEPFGDAEKAEMAARDRQWLARCRPIIEHDSYGVSRYRYAARGCEFGAGVD